MAGRECQKLSHDGEKEEDGEGSSKTGIEDCTYKGVQSLWSLPMVSTSCFTTMSWYLDCSDDEIKLAVCHMVDVVFPVDKITEEVKAACAAVEDD